MKIGLVHIAAAMWIALASASAHSDQEKQPAAGELAQEFPTLTPAELHSRIQGQTIVVVDANPADIFSKHHVPGAKHVEYDQVSASDLPADKAAPIVFYCMNTRCTASAVAAKRARQLGWTNIHLMPAGIQGWMKAGLPVVPART